MSDSHGLELAPMSNTSEDRANSLNRSIVPSETTSYVNRIRVAGEMGEQQSAQIPDDMSDRSDPSDAPDRTETRNMRGLESTGADQPGVAWYRRLSAWPTRNLQFRWRRFNAQDFLPAFMRVARVFLIFALKMVRMVLFLGHMYYFLSVILTTGSIATFSERYFGDILSYTFRNYPHIVERHCEIVQSGKGFMALEYRDWRSFLYDFVALNLGTKYYQTDKGVMCELNHDSLIYKFSDAVTKSAFLGPLPPASVTIFTVCIYLIYGLTASVLKVNMLIMFGLNFCQRLIPAARLIGNSVKTLWYQTSPSLF